VRYWSFAVNSALRAALGKLGLLGNEVQAIGPELELNQVGLIVLHLKSRQSVSPLASQARLP
jgi:hypothetical protein